MDKLDRRDYFAGLAFQAIIAKIPLQDSEGAFGQQTTKAANGALYADIADSACRYADALLTELNKTEKAPVPPTYYPVGMRHG